MQNFRELEVWNQGITLAIKAYAMVKKLPKEEEYGLKSQVRRASVSIPSCIAEGCRRNSSKEFGHFLQIAIGSSFEIETQLTIANHLKMISDEDTFEFIHELKIHQKKMNALLAKVTLRQTNALKTNN